MTPNKEQQEAIDYIVQMPHGTSVYLDGEAGSGKSFTIEQVNKKIPKLLKCAFTGNASQNINGVTFHSLFKIPFGYIWNPSHDFSEYRRQMFGKYGVSTAWRFKQNVKDVFLATYAIVVDEAPNASCYMIDQADQTLRWALGNPSKPFGGMRMVFSGDRGQLLPVVGNREARLLDSYGYSAPYDFLQAKVFQKCSMKHLHLTQLMRQKDVIDGNILSRIRTGSQTDSDLAYLNKNVTDTPPKGSRVISVLNAEARRLNTLMLDRELGEEKIFEEERSGSFREHKSKMGSYAPVLRLKIGCLVVIKINGKCKSNGEEVSYVNGDTGNFVGIDHHERLMIERDDGVMLYIKKHKHEDAVYKAKKKYRLDELGQRVEMLENERKVKGFILQYPISLAYAQTGNSSQGQTIEKVHFILPEGDMKWWNMIYTVCSRVPKLSNLTLNRPITHEDIHSTLQGVEKPVQQYELDINE